LLCALTCALSSPQLELIATQLRFHMDVLQNRKSDALEWTIIVLISAEIAVSLYDIFGSHL
jgi:uncharacterized Rmd1/YagE family protein